MAQTFPLMKLPPELRNCIYEAVVTSERIGVKKQPLLALFETWVHRPTPISSSSRILVANKQVSCEYDAVLKRLVLDPKATSIVIEEDWVDMTPYWDLEPSIHFCWHSYSIMSKLKLRVVFTDSDSETRSFWESDKGLKCWSMLCSSKREDDESRGRQIGREFGREYAKVLSILKDACR
ncbi:hypothetical protein KC335_g5454 [Hortaea werneckii]|nr:hypothetical protein KC358_g8357 [Hortaea werneckii]KAI6928335.1 hypothetical protein KC341_g11583 [Hortaea werneckii]KAI6961416.1 hypothetical protein KC321_g12329 [Hortaea werneckii]KAI6972209.1 hypothetical protein KC329_g12734 [Hortaea werneckii]KAI7046557.1 hypothetical protein KC366_g2935 [Hortaea werneckii]